MSTQMAPLGPALDFQALFESVPGMYLVLTPDLRIVAASEAYLRATMSKREDILHHGILEVFPDNPDDAEAAGIRNLGRSLERVLANKAPDAMGVQKYDVRRPAWAGGGLEPRYWVPINSPVLGKNGEVSYIIHQVQDLTGFVGVQQAESERDKLHRELETRSARLQAEIHAGAHDVQEANWLLEKAYQELTKLSEDLEARVAERTAQLAQANAQLESELAERKRLEQQLLHTQKLDAVGRLASGVAHDFNNLLTILQGYSELLLAQAEPGSPQRTQLEEITRASEGAAALTRQLLAFSRQQLLDVKAIDLNAVVTEVGTILRRSIGEDIELAVALDEAGCRVNADPGQMEQVLLNLAVNARDAMPRGGKLAIETANVELDEAYVRDHVSMVPGPYVMLAVSDTGLGMDEQTQQHLFEPFFTTKERGKGTGLGLSTVYGVVKQSGGNIWFYSEPGQGTTFRIFLPRAADSVTPADNAQLPPEMTRLEGTETVLLVEDEDAVRSLIRTSLQSKGYTVLEARLSSDALGILQEPGRQIDLVLTDVVLPGMSGPELAQSLRAIHPELKLLYMSGYTDDTLLRHGVLDPGNHFIQKPFRPDELVRKVREVIDATGAG